MKSDYPINERQLKFRTFIFLLSGLIYILNPVVSMAGVNETILKGAYDEVKNETRYNTKMLETYVAPSFKNGKDTGRAIYPGGDIHPDEGICADLIVRALRSAGIDLQKAVHLDVSKNKKVYGVKKPDRYSDQRRVWILNTFFKRKWKRLPVSVSNPKDWNPGDIIIWDTGSKRHLHIGIAGSKKRGDGFPHVIHNMRYVPLLFKGKTIEQDVLEGPRFLRFVLKKWSVIGHYRFIE